MTRTTALCVPLALAHLCPAQGWTLLDTSNTALPRNAVSFMVFDAHNHLWVGAEGNGDLGYGLYRFDGAAWTHYDEQDSPVLSNGARMGVLDADGNMWFSIFSRGVVKYDGSSWTVFNTTNSGIPSDQVTAMAVDGNGHLWLGTYGGGLARFDGAIWTNWGPSNAPFPQEYQCITALEFYSGKVYVGMECAHGLLHYDPATDAWGTVQGLPHTYVSALKNDGHGTLFVGYTHWGNMISRFDGTSWTTDALPGVYNKTQYNGMAVDLDGQVWISAIGLWYAVDGGLGLMGPPLPSDRGGAFNQSIAIGPGGSLWWAEQEGIWTNVDWTTIGVGELQQARQALSIHPNPATDRINVALPQWLQATTLRVHNALGALVLEAPATSGASAMIDCSALPVGPYSLVIVGKDGAQATGRFVIH